MTEVKCGLKDMPITKAIAKGKQALVQMENNSNFPEPVPAIAEVWQTVAKLEDLQRTIAIGNHIAVTLRNSQFTVFKQQLSMLVTYVNWKAGGDLAKLQSSGFEFAKHANRLPVPGKVQYIKFHSYAVDGECRLYWSAAKGRKQYVIQKTESPADIASWETVGATTDNTFNVAGFTRGQTIYFRVAAIGTAGRSPWSDLAKTTVQ